jgi:hypothetical protein
MGKPVRGLNFLLVVVSLKSNLGAGAHELSKQIHTWDTFSHGLKRGACWIVCADTGRIRSSQTVDERLASGSPDTSERSEHDRCPENAFRLHDRQRVEEVS